MTYTDLSLRIAGFLLMLVLALPAYSQLPERGLCAHRGAMDTHPENTLPAFRAAIAAGAQMIEFDVWLSKDGHMAVIHDATVDRTTDGSGKVSDLDWAELRALDAGGWMDPKFAGVTIPSLEEVLDIMPRNIWLNVHIKEDEVLPEQVALLLQRKGRLHQSFLACSGKAATAAQKAVPALLICNMDRRDTNDHYATETIRRNSAFIQIPKSGTPLSPESLQALRRLGVKINYFPAESIDEADSLLQAGVDFPLVNDIVGFMQQAPKLGLVPVKPEF
ncbi:glycerophosphodiester phosphodiesterase [Algoriphagus sp. H41]|uniref:Glycerophosphodiester phosphodiesterase n=1 Tax=Algoriphagus oliviformis TaxID=2811231 RepID=A0ABS3C9H1_9BACT|nr:glycerophosphodiester phosphodiesterase family protein [Algoriphagus oliviformis]MBN7812244.1 glycerophosphodiester phosphodiesterase [Algoriphagus oliviformis]